MYQARSEGNFLNCRLSLLTARLPGPWEQRESSRGVMALTSKKNVDSAHWRVLGPLASAELRHEVQSVALYP